MEAFTPLIQVFATVGAIMGFIEWRYRILHSCVRRVESRLDKHLDK